MFPLSVRATRFMVLFRGSACRSCCRHSACVFSDARVHVPVASGGGGGGLCLRWPNRVANDVSQAQQAYRESVTFFLHICCCRRSLVVGSCCFIAMVYVRSLFLPNNSMERCRKRVGDSMAVLPLPQHFLVFIIAVQREFARSLAEPALQRILGTCCPASCVLARQGL